MANRNQLRTNFPILIFDVEMLKAMADETRSRIIRLLCTPEAGFMRPYTVSDITDHFDLTTSTVSHHLQLLRRANLVKMERRGKERYYSLDFDSLLRRVGQFYGLLTSIKNATDEVKGEEGER